MNDISYYALRTRPIHRVEFAVMHALNQMEYPALVPTEKRKVIVRGKRTEVRYPWFPFYVFVGLPSPGAFQRLRSQVNDQAERMGKTPPILGLIGYGREPATLSNGDVQFLRGLSNREPTVFKIGSKVEIVDGPFSSLPGQVESVDEERVRVMLEMFGSQRTIEFKHANVRAA